MVVVDAGNQSISYFGGIVSVGDLFNVTSDGGTLNRVSIIIQSPGQDTVLQVVENIPVSCSNPLELLNRFGACQITGYQNEEQGDIVAFQSFEFARVVEVEVIAQALQTLTVFSLIMETNFAGTIDVTDNLLETVVTPSSPEKLVSLSGTIDSSVRRIYTVYFILEGWVGDGYCQYMEPDFFEA